MGAPSADGVVLIRKVVRVAAASSCQLGSETPGIVCMGQPHTAHAEHNVSAACGV